MKGRNIEWFENELNKIGDCIRRHNQEVYGESNCIALSDLESSCTNYRALRLTVKKNSKYNFDFNSLQFRRFAFFAVTIFAILLASKGGNWFFKSTSLSLFDRDANCLAALPDSWLNAFVPPNQCDFCRNLTTIDRMRRLSPEQFVNKYAYSKVPVVIVDGTQNWTAVKQFSFDYFKQLYFGPNANGGSSRKNCQFFPYKTEFRSLREVFQMDIARANYTENTAPWYIGWSNCDYQVTNELRRHYRKPYFLPNDSEAIRTDWIFMGTPNNGAHMHIDHVGRASWQAQIHGTKRWYLQPPLECYAECRDHTVDVNTGDIIVLDTNVWYHKTLIMGEQVSITIGAEYD